MITMISSTINKTPTSVQIHIGHIIIINFFRFFGPSLHVAAALVVSFLGQLAVELAVFHLTTALVHRFACFPASEFLRRAEPGHRKHRKHKTNA